MPNPTLLEKHPLLVNLAPDQLERIAQAGEVESYNPNEPIVSEGSLGDALFLILSGQVAVHKGAADVRDLVGRRVLRRDVARRAGAALGDCDVDVGDVPVPVAARSLRQLIATIRAAAVLLVQVVKTLSDRLRRANQMLSSVDMLADWLAGSMV